MSWRNHIYSAFIIDEKTITLDVNQIRAFTRLEKLECNIHCLYLYFISPTQDISSSFWASQNEQSHILVNPVSWQLLDFVTIYASVEVIF